MKSKGFTSGVFSNICRIFFFPCALQWPLNSKEAQELQSCNLYQRQRSGIPHKSSQTQMQSLIYEDGHINTPVGPSSPSGHFGFGDEEIKQSRRTERDTSHIKQLDPLIKAPVWNYRRSLWVIFFFGWSGLKRRHVLRNSLIPWVNLSLSSDFILLLPFRTCPVTCGRLGFGRV